MIDALTSDAVRQVEAAVAGSGEGRAAHLRQVLAVAGGQLAQLEGAAHVDGVFDRISEQLHASEEAAL